MRECFSEKRMPTPYQPNPHDGGWVVKTFNIWYVWRGIYVSLEKVFHFGKLSSYSNSFIYILRKIKMEKCLKIFLGIFFRFLHCSNGTKRRLDAAVILIEFFNFRFNLILGVLFTMKLLFFNFTDFFQARNAAFVRDNLPKYFWQLIFSMAIILIIEFKKKTKTS